MADRVYAAVDHAEASARNSEVDRAAPKADPLELPPSHNAVLTRGKVAQTAIQLSSLQLTIDISVKCKLDRHRARVAARGALAG